MHKLISILILFGALATPGCGLLPGDGDDPADSPEPSPSESPNPSPTPDPSACTTEVSGNLAAVTTWTKSDSPVCVTGELDVPEDGSLTIGPGVQVRFEGPFMLYVNSYARLATGGTANEPVVLTSASEVPLSGDWGPVVADFGAQLQLRFTKLAYGRGIYAYYAAVSIDDSLLRENAPANSPGVITVESGGNAEPSVRRTQVLDSDGSGIVLIRTGGTLEDNVIDNNAGAAIVLQGNYSDLVPTIRRNQLSRSSDAGIRVWQAESFSNHFDDIELNVIEDNRYGVYLEEDTSASIHTSHFLNNSDWNVYVTASAVSGASYATQSWWGTDVVDDIRLTIRDTSNHAVGIDPIATAPIDGAGPK